MTANTTLGDHNQVISTSTQVFHDSAAAPLGSHTYAVLQPILTGVIVTVILVLLCLVCGVLWYVCRHKGSYLTNEAKGAEHATTADAALKGDPSLQEATDESKKEYFI